VVGPMQSHVVPRGRALAQVAGRSGQQTGLRERTAMVEATCPKEKRCMEGMIECLLAT
jgi:hypothetical protein